jgi:hypothetical protein
MIRTRKRKKKMNVFKIITLTTIITIFSFSAFAEDKKKDCSIIKAETGMKMYEAWKCKMGKEDGEIIGKKFKNLFKTKI